MVEIDAMAAPLLNVADLPAMLNTSGTTHDTPKPTKIKPNPAVSG
ncbi:hypothetical protein MUGA111182_11510 [Mucilaginibacter galii]